MEEAGKSMESDLKDLEIRLNIVCKVDQPALAKFPSLEVCLRKGGPLSSESGWSCRAGFWRGGLAAAVDSDLSHGSLLVMFTSFARLSRSQS